MMRKGELIKCGEDAVTAAHAPATRHEKANEQNRAQAHLNRTDRMAHELTIYFTTRATCAAVLRNYEIDHLLRLPEREL